MTRGRCSWLKRCLYDCKKEKEVEHDITNINLGHYFDKMSSTLDTKIENDRKAIKNWQKVNLRLALFRNLSSKVKETANTCNCFERRFLRTETDTTAKIKAKKEMMNW